MKRNICPRTIFGARRESLPRWKRGCLRIGTGSSRSLCCSIYFVSFRFISFVSDQTNQALKLTSWVSVRRKKAEQKGSGTGSNGVPWRCWVRGLGWLELGLGFFSYPQRLQSPSFRGFFPCFLFFAQFVIWIMFFGFVGFGLIGNGKSDLRFLLKRLLLPFLRFIKCCIFQYVTYAIVSPADVWAFDKWVSKTRGD